MQPTDNQLQQTFETFITQVLKDTPNNYYMDNYRGFYLIVRINADGSESVIIDNNRHDKFDLIKMMQFAINIVKAL